MVPDGSLFAFGLCRVPRGFALKFKNRESDVEHRTDSQNVKLRLSLLLSVSFDKRAYLEASLVSGGSLLRSGCAVVLVDLRLNSKTGGSMSSTGRTRRI